MKAMSGAEPSAVQRGVVVMGEASESDDDDDDDDDAAPPSAQSSRAGLIQLQGRSLVLS